MDVGLGVAAAFGVRAVRSLHVRRVVAVIRFFTGVWIHRAVWRVMALRRSVEEAFRN